jgi:hypothetical protein
MTATAIMSNYQHISSLADYFLFPNSNKSVTNYKKVIEINTNKKSVSESQKLVNFLEETIMPNLPVKKDSVNIEEVQKHLDNTKDNKTKIDKIFSTIDDLFDSGEDVSIDDVHMMNFLANMKKAQGLLSYISDYLQLILEVQEANKDFQNMLNYAA